MNLFNAFFQSLEMRSGPVNLAATRAMAEPIVIDLRKRLEFLDDLRLCCLFQESVTTQTAGKGSDQVQKVKAANDLDSLFFGVL